MATKRMLVDAIHPEETRVVVTSGNRLEEFDFESAARRQLRGNIYLAKVTRVEPSLQAAFVEYGGNRHGFLAFSEIHPDYYQIPVADREALLRDEEDEDHAEADAPEESVSAPAEAEDHDHDHDADGDHSHIEQAPSGAETVESLGGGDALEEERPQRRRQHKYKIQEVIKRRQVMLVQVVKEERGNKGAALTTYLSLAGRYSVLMPNTARGGGISRKITSAADRKRLKEIVGDLEVPKGMGIILRTAGANRTKAEVKRDFEYLTRLWENVRNLTLRSQAPCLVYEEGSLIKRAIRDLYSKDIDEVFVAGDEAYREAKDFMRMIMPSHAKNVQGYRESQPIFSRYGIESQLDQMFSPQVTLPSGGYIVINPTEALVSIDVNSGRATKEHNIEDTALQTNLEAAEEIARQLRLRDLAGLIVIDFIDMMENRSNRAVERKLKDCLKNDRARIQVGRISHFGLMEMSRQRIRFGVVESSTHTCPVCAGTGLVRSVESLALMVMRNIEDHILRRSTESINVRVPAEVALYILNAKRHTLFELEARYDITITVSADGKLTGSQFAIEKGEARPHHPVEQRAVDHVRVDTATMDDLEEIEEDEEEEAEVEETAEVPAAEAEGEPSRRRRRRRRRGGERGEESRAPAREPGEETSLEDEDVGEEAEEPAQAAAESGEESSDEPRRRRRRGRRGGRRNRRGNEFGDNGAEGATPAAGDAGPAEAGVAAELAADESPEAYVESLGSNADVAVPEVAPAPEEIAPEAEAPVPEKPKRTRRKKAPESAEAAETAAAPAEAVAEPAAEADAKPKRTRTRKPKAEAAAAAPAEASVEAPVAEPIPAAEQPVAEAAGQAAPSEPAAPAEQAEPVEDDGASRRRRKDLPADDIVVTSSTPPAEGEVENQGDGEPEKKKKGGWWQRGFLGR